MLKEMENSSSSNTSTFLDSEFRYTLFPLFYGIVFVLGLSTNVYVLYVLRHLRDARAMSEVRIYMTNLTVADLLFVTALPFWIGYYARRGNWVYGDAMCRITASLFFINTYCSILFLAVISVNRYWAVTRPLEAAKSDHWRRGVCVSVGIWACTLSATIPYLVQPGIHVDGNVSRCLEGYHNETRKTRLAVAATHFVIIALFFVVFLLVVVCNVLIARALLTQPLIKERSIVQGTSGGGSSKIQPSGTKRRAVRMLCAVITVFAVCFLPHHVVQGPWALVALHLADGWSQSTRQRLNDAHQVTIMLMGLNCLLDPVVYCFATRKFRLYVISHFGRFSRGKGCQKTVTTNISMANQNQSIPSNESDKDPPKILVDSSLPLPKTNTPVTE
ncbi:platelet-activating factor receptor [Alosa sapidissima]|uniref:platelet-activating factor receptor n=1 Tax=Alosa sapidissima TaxID=34773 RepID=UPI001C085639|nr:platelet-activating factor receptor [Alosa sapidissima]